MELEVEVETETEVTEGTANTEEPRNEDERRRLFSVRLGFFVAPCLPFPPSPSFAEIRDLHSYRNATIGSIRVARSAGR